MVFIIQGIILKYDNESVQLTYASILKKKKKSKPGMGIIYFILLLRGKKNTTFLSRGARKVVHLFQSS